MPVSWTPVVDGVDDVMASHVNTLYDEVELGTLRGWYSRTLSTSDNVTLTDADMPLQFLTAVGGSLNLYLPAEAVANHSFIIVNESSDANTWTVMNDSSDTIGSVAQDENKQFVSNGVAWEVMTTGTSTAASTDTAGVVQLSGSSDIDTGTSATLATTPDAIAGSELGTDYITIPMNSDIALTTAVKRYYTVTAKTNGKNLIGLIATCTGASSSGAITITLKNGGTSMLTTNLTIDEGETSSTTAATPVVIDTGQDGVATGDRLLLEVSGAGTGVTYCDVTLSFRLP